MLSTNCEISYYYLDTEIIILVYDRSRKEHNTLLNIFQLIANPTTVK
jgi:hypothetical protein